MFPEGCRFRVLIGGVGLLFVASHIPPILVDGLPHDLEAPHFEHVEASAATTPPIIWSNS
jgi:hypothetical protein